MRSQAFICSWAILCLLWIACSKSVPSDIPAQNLPKGQTLTQDIVEIVSTITKGNSSSWKIDTMKVGSREDLDVLYFLDEAHGWIGSKGGLYKTADSGRTWKRVKIDVPPKADVVDIFFINSSQGWVAMKRDAPDVRTYQENQLWLMQTNDGGQTWRLQYTEKASLVTHVSFTGDQEGWLTGIKYIGISPLRFAPLVLHTSDQGQRWTDVSSELNHTAADGNDSANDWITSIIPESQLTATVLTLRGKIFKTVNGGQSWQQVGVIRDEPQQTCICHLGVKEGKHLWVAGGADSDEGMWGMIAMEQANNSWKRYRLREVYFADALFLSEQQVLACGSIPANEGEGPFRSGRHGVILYSSDSGRNWSIIYRNAQVKTINALAAADSGHIWAASEDGLILHLEPSSKKISDSVDE